MTRLMAWAAFAGAVIGLVLLGAEGIAVTTGDRTAVVYEGAYEPLRGVEMTSETSQDLDRAFEDAQKWWNRLILPWWAYPLIGAGSAAVLSTPFAIASMRIAGEGQLRGRSDDTRTRIDLHTNAEEFRYVR